MRERERETGHRGTRGHRGTIGHRGMTGHKNVQETEWCLFTLKRSRKASRGSGGLSPRPAHLLMNWIVRTNFANVLAPPSSSSSSSPGWVDGVRERGEEAGDRWSSSTDECSSITIRGGEGSIPWRNREVQSPSRHLSIMHTRTNLRKESLSFILANVNTQALQGGVGGTWV